MTAANRTPTWVGGLIGALLGWRVGMNPPGVGLDASWNAGLAMGVHDGLYWGKVEARAGQSVPVPEARKIAVEGGSATLTYEFFSMRVR